MPRDWNDAPEKSGIPDLSGEFNSAPERLEQVEPPKDLSETVRAEINARDDAADAIDRHDEVWNRERDKLAAKMGAAPHLSPDGSTPDSVIEEYEERRDRWLDKRDQITEGYVREVSSLREHGQTLSGEFFAPGPAPETDVPKPDVEAKREPELSRDYGPRRESSPLDADQAPGLQAEFTRGAPGRSGHSR